VFNLESLFLFLVIICGLCVGQVIVIIQRDPSESEIQNSLFYIPINIFLKLKFLQNVLQVSSVPKGKRSI